MRDREGRERSAAPQSRPKPRRPSPSTGRRHETRTKYTTAPRLARLAQSRSAGVVRAFVFDVYGETTEDTRAEISEMASVGAANRWRGMGHASMHTPACACGCFPEFRWAARVCRSAVRRTKTSISKKQNEKNAVAMALRLGRLSLRIATTASTVLAS